MKHIFLLTTVIILVSCGQNKEKGTASTKSDYNKDSLSQTKSNNGRASEAKAIEENTPVDVALTFINSYVIDCNKIKESVGYTAFVNASKLTTNNFKTELKKIVDEANRIDPEMGLDFDPIVDAQDYPDQGFELESFDIKSNFIVVKGKNADNFKVTIKVIKKENKWLVDGCGIVNIPEDKRSDR